MTAAAARQRRREERDRRGTAAGWQARCRGGRGVGQSKVTDLGTAHRVPGFHFLRCKFRIERTIKWIKDDQMDEPKRRRGAPEGERNGRYVHRSIQPRETGRTPAR